MAGNYRESDPHTSRNGWKRYEPKAGSDLAEVCKWVAANPGRTAADMDAADILPGKSDGAHKRVSDGVKRGVLRYGPDVLSWNGEEAQSVWLAENCLPCAAGLHNLCEIVNCLCECPT